MSALPLSVARRQALVAALVIALRMPPRPDFDLDRAPSTEFAEVRELLAAFQLPRK